MTIFTTSVEEDCCTGADESETAYYATDDTAYRAPGKTAASG
jgi:hypothetical protein